MSFDTRPAMWTTDKLQDVIDYLRGLTYKPNTSIGVREERDAIVLSVDAQLPDAEGEWGNRTTIRVHLSRSIDKMYLQAIRVSERLAYVQMMVRDLITEFELHEMDEWLKHDGKRLREPH